MAGLIEKRKTITGLQFANRPKDNVPWDRAYVMPNGKHRGKTLDQIPLLYYVGFFEHRPCGGRKGHECEQQVYSYFREMGYKVTDKAWWLRPIDNGE